MSEEEEFEVERLLDIRHTDGITEYLVKWKGYPMAEATWEPSENLTGCRELMDEMNAKENKSSNNIPQVDYTSSEENQNNKSDSSDSCKAIDYSNEEEPSSRETLIIDTDEDPLLVIPSCSDTDDADHLTIYEQRIEFESSESFDISDDSPAPEPIIETIPLQENPVSEESHVCPEDPMETCVEESCDFTLEGSDDAATLHDPKPFVLPEIHVYDRMCNETEHIMSRYSGISNEFTSESNYFHAEQTDIFQKECNITPMDDIIEDSLELSFSCMCTDEDDLVTFPIRDENMRRELIMRIEASNCQISRERLAIASAMRRGLENCLTEAVDEMLAGLSAPTFKQFLTQLTAVDSPYQNAKQWLADLVNEMHKVVGFIGRDSECSVCILTVLNDVVFNVKPLIKETTGEDMKQALHTTKSRAISITDNMPDSLDDLVRLMKYNEPVQNRRGKHPGLK